MDGYDSGYGTQLQSYPQYRRVLVDGTGRVISDAVATQPMRILCTSSQQPQVHDHPRTQVGLVFVGNSFFLTLPEMDTQPRTLYTQPDPV